MLSQRAVPALPADREDTAARAPAYAERIVIVPTGRRGTLQLKTLWAYRELLYFLSWRDIKVRYRRTLLGAAWAIIQPILMMTVFTIFFGMLAGIASDGVPYAAFALAALVPWMFFSNGMMSSATSVETQSYLINKVYFPRLLLPVSCVIAGSIDFGVNLILLLGLSIYWCGLPTASWLLVPPLILLTVLIALGVGIWFAALQARFKDVQFLMGFFTQLWMFLTPIAYPSSLISPRWRMLYALNPMVGVVEGFRWALLRTPTAPVPQLLISAGMAVLLLITGARHFRRVEYVFADVI